MIKNQKDVAKAVAPSIGVSEKEVIQVLNLLMHSAKEKLESIEGNEIYIYNLGSFVTKRKKVHDLIKYYEVRKAKLAEKDFDEKIKETLIADCEFKIQQLINRREEYKTKDSARKEFKQAQNEQSNDVGSVQESESDLGGLQE